MFLLPKFCPQKAAMVCPIATMPWVSTFWILHAAVKAATATDPNILIAVCMTIVPAAVTANWSAIGMPMRS